MTKIQESRGFKVIRKNINFICRYDGNSKVDFVNYNASYVRSMLEAGYKFEDIDAIFQKSKSENVKYHGNRIAKEFK